MTGEDIARAYEKLNNLKDQDLSKEWETDAIRPLFQEHLLWIDRNLNFLSTKEKRDSEDLLGKKQYREFGTYVASLIRLIEEIKLL